MKTLFVRKVVVNVSGLELRAYLPTLLGRAFGMENQVRWCIFPTESWVIQGTRRGEPKKEIPLTKEGLTAFHLGTQYTFKTVNWGRPDLIQVHVMYEGYRKKNQQTVKPDGTVSPWEVVSEDLTPPDDESDNGPLLALLLEEEEDDRPSPDTVG